MHGGSVIPVYVTWKISRIHEEYRQVYGSRKMTQELNNRMDKPINHKRVERIMRENGIHSKVTKKYKATTKSHHNLPVAPNILDRDFTAEKTAQKMVSDITYIPAEEGWLYLAGVMDLCGQKIVGISMDGQIDKGIGYPCLGGCDKPFRQGKGLYPAF